MVTLIAPVPLLAAFAALLPQARWLEPPEKPEAEPVVKAPEAPKPASLPSAPVAFPHPLITEVLYAVPTGPEGDANRDGARHVAGDEFVELINPHDRPIQLLGYTITDRNPANKGQLRFTFPALELPPSGVVVVFNGCEQAWSGGSSSEAGPGSSIGDSRKAPDRPSDRFHGAYVFTARVPTSRTSWANGGDYALLSDPAGRAVHCVAWGTYKEPTPAAALLEHSPTTSRCSVQRRAINDIFVQHVELPGAAEAAPFSPGEFKPAPPRTDDGPTAPGRPASTPTEPPSPDKTPAPKPMPLEIKPPPPKHPKP